MITILFYILSTITLATAFLTIITRNPVHSAIYLMICFFSIAGHYLMFNAQFLAIVHIIVYSGAIMVLLLFTLMLMNLSAKDEPHKSIINRIAATASFCLVAVILLAVFIKAQPTIDQYKATGIDFQSIRIIGQILINDYSVPFEFASLLLLLSMIGAVLLSKKEKNSEI